MLFLRYRKKIKLLVQAWLYCCASHWGPLPPPPPPLALSGPLPHPRLPRELAASYHSPTDSTADPEAVLAEATSQLHSRFGFSSCALQVEQYQPEMAQCLRCREPPQA